MNQFLESSSVRLFLFLFGYWSARHDLNLLREGWRGSGKDACLFDFPFRFLEREVRFHGSPKILVLLEDC